MAHTVTQVTVGKLPVICGLVKEALVRNPLLSQTGKSRSLPDHFHIAVLQAT